MHNLRAIYIIWYREVLRWWRNRSRIVGSFGMPILFLFIFGSGLSPAMGGLTQGIASASPMGPKGVGIDFVKFIFPGIIGMNVLMGSMMSGISIVWDREFGFLKEILVAPINRTVVAIGKTLGGSTTGVIQGLLLLVLAPLIGVTISAGMVVKLVPLLFLISFSITSLGVLIGARMKSTEGFQVIMQFILMPMIFVSGALFPMRNLPAWMNFLVKVNPVTYAIDPLRKIIFEAQGLPASVLEMLPQAGLGVTLFGHAVTMREDIAIIGLFGAVMTAAAVWMFNIQD
jgi:ABC-2 type transport system permease protein